MKSLGYSGYIQSTSVTRMCADKLVLVLLYNSLAIGLIITMDKLWASCIQFSILSLILVVLYFTL